MRYRSTILIGVLTVFLSSPTYTNGQPKLKSSVPAILLDANSYPDLQVKVTGSQEVLFGDTKQDGTLSIDITNALTYKPPSLLFGSEASPVTLRITLPYEKTLSQVGMTGADSGFNCNTYDNNVLCTDGTIRAGGQAHISLSVKGGYPSPRGCSSLAPVTVEVDPTQNEVDRTNNTATTYVLVVYTDGERCP
jgi:hypothetical protein